MTLGQHLREFRKRLYIAALGIFIGGVGGWFAADFVLNALRQPIFALAEAQGRVATLNYDGVTSAFDLKLQIALTVGLVVSSPVWLYQIWAFFVPAMTRREIQYVLAFFLTAIPLFLAGCYAGWAVFPRIVLLMTSFAPADDASILTAKTYFDFVLKLVIVVGVGFVLPVFLVLLNFAGVLSAKSILKSWRVAVLIIALFTANSFAITRFHLDRRKTCCLNDRFGEHQGSLGIKSGVFLELFPDELLDLLEGLNVILSHYGDGSA
jgi:sec-independent protein translocase protein TatC